jgi:hypothetical protein
MPPYAPIGKELSLQGGRRCAGSSMLLAPSCLTAFARTTLRNLRLLVFWQALMINPTIPRARNPGIFTKYGFDPPSLRYNVRFDCNRKELWKPNA